MQQILTDGLPMLFPALEGTAALFLGLTLTQMQPVSRWRAALPLIVVFGAASGICQILAVPTFYILIAAALLVPAIRFLFSASWIYGAVTALLSGTLFGFQRLAALVVPESVVLIAAVALAALCWWRNAAILPEISQIPVISNQEQAGRFAFSFALIAISLGQALLWLCWSIPRISFASRPDQLEVLGFSAAALVTLLAVARRLSFGAMERIEAMIDKQYQTELVNFMQIIRSQRHDFNFHMQAISGMIEGGRYQECRDYVRQMAKSTSVMNDMLPLADSAVSAMINSFRELALQKDIRLDVSIHNDLSHFPCSVYETNTIIGNMIQNAIDEVERNQQDRWIDLLILKRGGDIIIKVTNPCSRPPEAFKDVFRPGYSTKQAHEGIGLTTVSRLVSRYSGSVHPEFDDGTISFIVRIAAQ